jgi:Predicted membrane protein
MKEEYGVIKAQLPMAVAMAIVHILLMYFLAF